ncbi:MAG: hypothetical protein EB084_07120 [Proteobacteria bacterium]|nr:hypothetical protein [Pseudomonadota bacterium]
MSQPAAEAEHEAGEEEGGRAITCPLCQSAEFVKRLLFFTYCANPAHTHKQGEVAINTVLEFRQCVEHGVRDGCVRTVFDAEPQP